MSSIKKTNKYISSDTINHLDDESSEVELPLQNQRFETEKSSSDKLVIEKQRIKLDTEIQSLNGNLYMDYTIFAKSSELVACTESIGQLTNELSKFSKEIMHLAKYQSQLIGQKENYELDLIKKNKEISILLADNQQLTKANQTLKKEIKQINEEANELFEVNEQLADENLYLLLQVTELTEEKNVSKK